MRMMYVWLFLCATVFCTVVNGAKILAIFPVPVKSHFVMTKTILTALAKNGHEIDLYTIFPEETKIPRINHHQIPGISLLETPLSVTDLRAFTLTEIIELMFTEKGNGNYVCEQSFKTDVLKKLKHSEKKYDLLLLEIFVVDCFFGFSHVFKAPVVGLTSSIDLPWGSYRIGNIDNPSYISTYFGEFGKEMTLYERIQNVFTLIYAKYRHSVHLNYQENLAKQFFEDDSLALNELVSNTSLMIVNSHFSLNEPRPTIPNFIEVAGIHIGEPKEVPKDISDFIDNGKFVYFSFGSIVGSETLPLKELQYILSLLGELNYKVIWKANKSSIPKGLIIPKHVLIKPWMPQLDILCHPKIQFFITHSGLMGTQEAIYCGVPMLSVPIFADQFLNSKNCKNKEIGLGFNIENTSTQEIKGIIEELIGNPKYKINMRKISEQFKDRPIKPLEEAVYWIEYVIRYKGAPQLKSRSADLPWYQYYLVDIGAICTVILVIILYISYHLLSCLLICSKKIKNKEKHH